MKRSPFTPTLLGALGLTAAGLFDFSIKEAAALGIIGGADGPTAIYVAGMLAPDLLGGARNFMIGSLIEEQFKGNAGNWPFGAAASMIQELLTHANEEMGHAIAVSERIDFLGGVPAVDVEKIETSSDSTEIPGQDLAGEFHRHRAHRHPPVVDAGLVADLLGGGDGVFLCGIFVGVEQVVHHGVGEQKCLLQHNTDRATQFMKVVLADIDTVEQDPTLPNVVQPGQQAYQRGLSDMDDRVA